MSPWPFPENGNKSRIYLLHFDKALIVSGGSVSCFLSKWGKSGCALPFPETNF
jgi:hypothetical protein